MDVEIPESPLGASLLHEKMPRERLKAGREEEGSGEEEERI